MYVKISFNIIIMLVAGLYGLVVVVDIVCWLVDWITGLMADGDVGRA